ncbi:MAG TPA: hypothetical protein DEA22_00775 [Blastocatellia bacterium]|nr:hypothetical protein [Blastocatellia bacterium]
MQYKILIVDDETANLRLLERLFRGSYEVHTAASGTEALDLLEKHDIALIITDQRMPGLTGIEFLKLAAGMRPQTVRIMLTGYTDAEALVEAINTGVLYKYVTKPWSNEELQLTAKRSLQHYETIKAQRQLQLQNERLCGRLQTMRDRMIKIIGEMLDLKGADTRAHAQRTSEYAVEIGRKMNFSRLELEQLAHAAFLHEAVDFRIPAHLLQKEAPLTESEREVVEQGLAIGLGLFEDMPEFEEIYSVLQFIHEHYDGSGLPKGFSYDQIPLHARIIAVADAYDNWTAHCSQQTRLTDEMAMAKLLKLAGTKFDPDAVRVFCEPVHDFVPVRPTANAEFSGIYSE